RPLRRDVADEQAEGAGADRGDDLLVELGQIEERTQRKKEGRETGATRQDRVADLLGRACFHFLWCAPCDGMPAHRARVKAAGLRKGQRRRKMTYKLPPPP